MDTLQNVGMAIIVVLVLIMLAVWEMNMWAAIWMVLGAIISTFSLWLFGWYIEKFKTEFLPNGFKDLDPTARYKRLYSHKRDGEEEHYVVFQVCGQKEKYAVKTRRLPSKYFLVTPDGNWISYLNAPPGTGEPRHEGPGKVIDMFKKRNGR